MANTMNSNTIYVDSTGDISDTAGILIDDIVLTATSANATVTIRDQASGNPVKLEIRLSTNGETTNLELKRPIHIPTGLNIGTITNCVLTIIFRRQGE